MRQQRQQEMQRQQQEQARRQQQEQMRRQQEQARQQQMQQQQMMRERQQQMQQRQQQAIQQRQQVVDRQRQMQQQQQQQEQQKSQRQRQEQQRTQGQQQLSKQQQASQQRQVLQQQRQVKERQVRLTRLQQERARRQQVEKKKEPGTVSSMAALLGRTKPNTLNSLSRPVGQNQSLAQFQERRLQQRTQQRVTKQLEGQRKVVKVRMQKVREARKRMALRRQIAEKQLRNQTENQKLAEQNFNIVCTGPGCSCSFHGDTQVLTKDGYEPIKSLVVGKDYVWAMDEVTGAMDWKPITAHYSNPYEETAVISIRGETDDQAQTILSNLIHPFYVRASASSLGVQGERSESTPKSKGQWVQAQHLHLGDQLLTDSGHSAEVLGLESKKEPVEAYNIAVESFHTYFVRGAKNDSAPSVLVHNECGSDGTVAKGGMLGTRGVQTPSKTIWKGEGKERIDVENPNPGQRPGQIHFQDNEGNKYLYDPATKSFPSAPKSVNSLLENPRFRKAINKGMKKYLGE